MDQGPREPGDQGRLGRQQHGDNARPHPPEQYPGYKGEDRARDERELRDDRSGEVRDRNDRGYDERGYSQTDSRSGGGHTYQEERRSGGKGWGIAALVVSILAFLTAFVGLVTFIFAVPGLILGFVARSKGARGLGLTSIILSIIAIVIGTVLTAIVVFIFGNSPEFQQLMQDIQQQQ